MKAGFHHEGHEEHEILGQFYRKTLRVLRGVKDFVIRRTILLTGAQAHPARSKLARGPKSLNQTSADEGNCYAHS
ncbi:MAG: hypothetical protein ACM3TN_00965 [Alphaproteobacteria bacterium]